MQDRVCRTSNRRVVTLLVATSVFLLGDLRALAQSDSATAQARTIIERTSVRRGVVAVVGNADLALALARESELLVHVRDADAAAVAALRKRGDEAGLGIQRLAVEHGSLDALPYAENTIDIVVLAGDAAGRLRDEAKRVLRPEGTAFFGDDTFRKPPLEGVDEWTHWEHGPANNPVSSDTVIKAPYMTQFLATPFYIGMPAITTAAAGRTFLAIGHIAHHQREWDGLNRLIGRNGYNGTVLWERKLPEGYLVHRSAFIASKETFYMIDGERCLLLDPQTGKEKGEIRIAGVKGDWKWMAMVDDVLYVLAGKPGPGAKTTKGDRVFGGWSWGDLSRGYYGKRIPFGFGDTLAAYDVAQKKPLWIHKEETLIDARGMAMRDGKVFVYCPDRHLRALSAETGKVMWTNSETEVLGLIEQPGRGLRSTPGFRTACMTVATPRALIIQGQTRMNVVAISTADGYLLWKKKKITNNPNAIYVDGQVVLGVGPGGSHVAVDPVSGVVNEDFGFHKRACTRLTASPDSFFCRAGEGTIRWDRASKKLLVDGSMRPACNDGALPANGLLYMGPWQCDCNLSLIGHVAQCSAGDFKFDRIATEAERLETGDGDIENVKPLPIADGDWPGYRGSNSRSSGTTVRVAESVRQKWAFRADQPYVPTAPVSAGGLVFVGGNDGKVRALDAKSGAVRWTFATSAPIKQPPAIWQGRVYFGSSDGYAYCLEAATGRLLWRFRAAPVERHIMVYGHLGSTWPVSSGVLVHDGVAYFAAGIIDHDGTYVYAVDAKTGTIKWQNNSSGHLAADLRKGVSVAGNLTVQGDRLLLAGGNQVSPAPFDLATGKCLAESFTQGQSKANNGRYVGVFRNDTAIAGGKILYAAPQNVSTKSSFLAFADAGSFQLNRGAIPPAWNGETVALVNSKRGKLTCFDADKVAAQIKEGYGTPRRPGADRRVRNLTAALEAGGAIRWRSDLGQSNKFEAVSLAVCPNAVVAVVGYQNSGRAHPEWFVVGFNSENGQTHFRQSLGGEPLPEGLLVDKDGQIVVTMLDGRVLCFGAADGGQARRPTDRLRD